MKIHIGDLNKGGERQAYQELLNYLDLKGHIVSMDAGGCYAEVTNKMIEGGGNYVVCLKSNQKTLRRHIEEYFENKSMKGRKYETREEKGHGRLETRICRVIDLPEDFEEKLNWRRNKE